MKTDTLKSDFILFIVAFIWGLAFVAQRAGMEHIGPFTFNGIRFFLGGISLFPFLLVLNRKERTSIKEKMKKKSERRALLKGALIASIFLFGGISFQQVGLVYTTAGKAGFITGLYVVFVPILGFAFKQDKTDLFTWIGAVLAAVGMYFLSVTEQFTISFGDFLELLCAVCFAAHVIVIGRLSKKFHTAHLAFLQYMLCSVVSMIVALVFEEISGAGIVKAAIPIFYGGVFSVGIAYSLQIYGQRKSPAAHAAIILSIEAFFAALGGWIILGEILSGRGLLGCALMLTGMMISQLFKKRGANVPTG